MREASGYRIAALFAKCAAFSRQKVPSVALLVGEKWRTCRHVFKCHHGMFVALFLTYTVAKLIQYLTSGSDWYIRILYRKCSIKRSGIIFFEQTGEDGIYYFGTESFKLDASWMHAYMY